MVGGSTVEHLQAGLGEALALNRPGSTTDHAVVALPSFSVGESLLSHYVERIPALEHRYLLAQLMVPRIPGCELVFVTSQAPEQSVLDYYVSLVPPDAQADMRRRFRVLEVPDRSGRAIAAKLLDRPDLLEELRASLAGRPGHLEPWNVSRSEVDVALQLGMPINGTSPDLWPLGFKSAGRKLLREAGVPVPFGCEDVRSPAEVLEAIAGIRSARPTASGVVVKLDDSGAGDGNVVVDLRAPGGEGEAVAALPDWFVADLASGGIVEELVSGARFTSPSAQIDLGPDGTVDVLSTHEQLLGGPGGQVYMGCRFPADPAYAAELAGHARSVGAVLAERGAIGRVAVDFAAAQDASGRWDVYALEMNLRKGGTTHPYTTLRHLVPGHYDDQAARWVCDSDGSERAYWSTDNLVDPWWTGRAPASVIEAVADAGLQFDPGTGTGVVLHMLSCLAIDGRLGLTAIGTSHAHAEQLYQEAAGAIAGHDR